MTKFLLDSGDPDEYKKLAQIAKDKTFEIWGATTNPTLIAKKLTGKKISQKEAFELQKQIVLEIAAIVPGAVSAEVYADETTKAEEMIEQGKEIATWHKRVVVKLPTTLEGFKARTALRKEKIITNNTLVFSQEQVFAICLHERIMQNTFGHINDSYPPFISPFVGRLDDIGENGMEFVAHSMQTKQKYHFNVWILEASVRSTSHIKRGIELDVELMTAPLKTYQEWNSLSEGEREALKSTSDTNNLNSLPYWQPLQELLDIKTDEELMQALESNKLNIHHPLTDSGILKFAQDWKAILL